ncbi:hypothetical protein KI387_008718, partial [Taxus chinensis]
ALGVFLITNSCREYLKKMECLGIGKERKPSLVVKTWKRINGWKKPTTRHPLVPLVSLNRSSSWHPLSANLEDEKPSSIPMTPRGHVAVYVGKDRQRFVIKTDYLNHPLFRKLLDESEREYGFHSEGPLVLPCKVGLFQRILWMLKTDYQKYKSAAEDLS